MWTLDKVNKDIQLWSDFYKIGKYKFLVLFVKYPEFDDSAVSVPRVAL